MRHAEKAGEIAAKLATVSSSLSPRRRRARAAMIARRTERFVEDHTALAIAIVLNLLIFFLLGRIVLRPAMQKAAPDMQVAMGAPAATQPLPPPSRPDNPPVDTSLAAISANSTTPDAIDMEPVSMPDPTQLNDSKVTSMPTSLPPQIGMPVFGLGGPAGQGLIGDMTVRARKLGVVLDTSGSMTDRIAGCIAEIKKSYPNAIGVGVDGCGLGPGEIVTDAYISGLKEDPIPFAVGDFTGHDFESTVEAMVRLVTKGQVDAIYWYSDFEDDEDPQAAQALMEFLRAHHVRLYIHSVEKKPSDAVRTGIQETGGDASYPNKS